MCKYILPILALALVALMALAAVVVQEYGWVGFLALLGVLLLLGYAVRKGTRPLLLYLVTRPVRRWAAALRGARIVVHSIGPCAPPPAAEYDLRADPEAIGDDGEWVEAADSGDVEPEEDEDAAGPIAWYQIDFTVIPPGGQSSEGRIVTRRGWSPQLVGAVGPRPGSTGPFGGWPPPDPVPGDVPSLGPDAWTGSDWADPDGTVFGERRLRLRVGVARNVRAVTITYARFTELGLINLPPIEPSGADR